MEIVFKYIIKFFSSLIMISAIVFIWHKLLERKINFKSLKLYAIIVFLSIISILNYYSVNQFIRILVITVFLIISMSLIFKDKIYVLILTPIYTQFIFMFSEMIFALLATLIFRQDSQAIVDTYFGTFVSNFIITIISLFIFQLKFIKKIYRALLNLTDKIEDIQLSFFCLVIVLLSNILAMTVYYKIEFQYLLLFNVSMILFCAFIVVYSLRTKNNYNKVSDKYNVAIKSLKDYEDMMSKYRVTNHENKNLLKTIRAMIINKEKDIPKYIDSIVEEKYNDDEKLLLEMNVIPTGGLRATIYSEILKIKENKINYTLSIDKNIKTVDLIELDTNTIIDICKIIGVLIDNAIEEVKDLKKKEILISLFIDSNKLNIKVSNNYEGKINLDKIYDEGYTTKGNGHGYGLSLVREIVESSPIFENEIEINDEIFSQLLTIKIKKKRKGKNKRS